ncbi:hypothetical protein V8E55_003884 [Tylopilus felleus]
MTELDTTIDSKEDLTPKDKLVHMMKDWNSPVDAFFQPTPAIEEVGGWRSHIFKCCMRGCKVTCWGTETLKAVDTMKNVDDVHEKIVGSVLCTRSITQAFEKKGQGKGRDSQMGVREPVTIFNHQGSWLSVFDENRMSRVLHTIGVDCLPRRLACIGKDPSKSS